MEIWSNNHHTRPRSNKVLSSYGSFQLLRFYSTFFRNSRIMKCLFFAIYIYISGLADRLHLASIENSLLPGKKFIRSLHSSLLRQPIPRIASSSAEYFKKPPTLSSSLIKLYTSSFHLFMTSLTEQPILPAKTPQSVIPSSSTKLFNLSSSLRFQLSLQPWFFEADTYSLYSASKMSSMWLWLRTLLCTDSLETAFLISGCLKAYLLDLESEVYTFLTGCVSFLMGAGAFLTLSFLGCFYYSRGFSCLSLQCHRLMTESRDRSLLKCVRITFQLVVPYFLTNLTSSRSSSQVHFCSMSL